MRPSQLRAVAAVGRKDDVFANRSIRYEMSGGHKGRIYEAAMLAFGERIAL